MPEAQAGAHRPAGGEGESFEERQRGALQHRIGTPGSGRPAQTEGPDTREQRLSADAYKQDGSVLKPETRDWQKSNNTGDVHAQDWNTGLTAAQGRGLWADNSVGCLGWKDW